MGRRADLKTGYDCNCNCVFCVIGDKLFTGDRSTAQCLDELERSRRTCEDVVFTGAEVTIRPDYFTLLQAAKRLGYRTIQVQTNGRMLSYRQFAAKSVAAGANEFSPSIHGATARIHDALVRSRGSFEQVTAAIENLVALGQRVVTNTVITRRNAAELPDLARMLVRMKVSQFQLAFPHPTGHAATHFGAVVPRMSEVAPTVHEALEIGRNAGISCMAEAMPFCQMQGFEPQVAELHIPPTEIVYDGYVVPDYAADRMQRGKTRFPQCATCRFEPICEGPWKEYPERMGGQEFQPIAGPRVVDPALVLDPRWTMLGAPAPAWPAGVPRQREPGRLLVLVFFPEAGSPSCTTQLCAVASKWSDLEAAGVDVLGVSPDAAGDQRAFADRHGLPFGLISDGDGSLSRAFRAIDRERFMRTTYLLDADNRIAHLIVRPDVAHHPAQILDAIARLRAPARPLGPVEPLVVLRRGKPSLDTEGSGGDGEARADP